jgi:hypothetical protein
VKTPYRVFVAHPRSMEEAVIETTCAAVQQLLAEKNVDLEVAVTSARDDYSARSLACGGWDRWCNSISDVVDLFTREPRFHAVVVPRAPLDCDRTVTIGRATAVICKAIVSVDRPLLVFDFDARALFPAWGVRTIDADNWKAGWRILY